MIDDSLDVTFVVPCLNEAANIADTLETIRAAMSEFRFAYEILVIDDGSTDNTAVVVEEYRLAHPDVELRLHKNPRNLGLATSFVNGAFVGKGKYYKLVSGDNAEPQESLVKVFSHLGEADMLVAYMTHVEGKSVFRKGLSNLYTFLINFISGYKLKYYNGAAVHLRYNVMRWGPYSFGFGFQAELITKLLDEGASYTEIPVLFMHRQKSGGNSALNLKNFLSVCHTLLELLIRRVRRKTMGR
jgi:glycosyltransferase involved in cell wall biosynthesis